MSLVLLPVHIILTTLGINSDGLGVFIIPVCRYVVISIFSNAELLIHFYACFGLPQRHDVCTYLCMCMYVCTV